ncbi:MAG: T9SS type A sorting domain-containing protein [candidate division WOR-3 bacterium]
MWYWNFPTDSVIGYIWCDAVYDNNNHLHVVFTVIDTIGQGSAGSGWRSQIRHWNQATGQVSIVASGWYEISPGPGANHPTVSEPQIGINRVTGDLYCTWCKADTNDIAQNGLANLDVWGARSTDNGLTWIEHHNITNSHTPGAPPGECDDDRYQTLNSEVNDAGSGFDTLYLFYLNDKEAGPWQYYPPGIMTENPVLFYAYAWNPHGIVENITQIPKKFGLEIIPNPVSGQTEIIYTTPKSGDVSIQLYSVDGRMVQTIDQKYKEGGKHRMVLSVREFTSGIYVVILNVDNQRTTGKLVVTR